MGSARATAVIWVGHESPSLEVGAGRPARRHDHTTGDDGYGMKLLIVGQQS